MQKFSQKCLHVRVCTLRDRLAVIKFATSLSAQVESHTINSQALIKHGDLGSHLNVCSPVADGEKEQFSVPYFR